MKLPVLVISGLLVATSSNLRAGCFLHHSPAEIFQGADAVAEYRILSKAIVAHATGVSTRYTAELNQISKGTPPEDLTFASPGGSTAGTMEISSDHVDLEAGGDYILHLHRLADGSWRPSPFHTTRVEGTPAEKGAIRTYFQNGAEGDFPELVAPLSTREVTPTGYLHFNGAPARTPTCDGGVPIPYLVDVDPAKLPPGMDTADALAAVEEVLDAWSSVSSLRFRFDGLQSFGMAAADVAANDGRLRIQLHDTYGYVNAPAIGRGGALASTHPSIFLGGRVGSQGFGEILRMSMVLEDSEMENETMFKSVLTHEIGHALGLAHSSEDEDEANAVLRNATMYFQLTGNGNGASLGSYDVDRIRYGYPSTDTPPYTIERFIHAVTRSSTSNGALPVATGVNRIDLQAIDLQGGTLTPVLSSASPSLSLSGMQLVFTPQDFLTGARIPEEDIAAGSSYSSAYLQIGDGVNLSRAARCSVIQILGDSRPVDGLPNSWMTTHFGTIEPGAAGTPRHPDSDPDNDGLSNRTEYNLNTSPISAASPGPGALTYNHASRDLVLNPLRFAPYRIQASTDLVNWTTRALFTTSEVPSPVTYDTEQDLSAKTFYRALPTP